MNGLVPGASFTDFVRGELVSLVFRTMTRQDITIFYRDCTVYSVQCTVYSVQCTVYSVHAISSDSQVSIHSLKSDLRISVSEALEKIVRNIHFTN